MGFRLDEEIENSEKQRRGNYISCEALFLQYKRVLCHPEIHGQLCFFAWTDFVYSLGVQPINLRNSFV